MEIIIAIFFFSVASAVCLRLFASAHTMSEGDKDLNNALMWSQNLSESFYGCNGNLLQVKNLYPNAFLSQGEKETDGTIILFFDENWEEIDNALSSASYEAIIVIRGDTAENIYSDVNEYGVSLKGQAIEGTVAILDIRQKSEGFMEIPEDDSYTIFSNKVDVYRGE